MLEAVKDNATPRGIYLADFGVNSMGAVGQKGKIYSFLILKRTISGESNVHFLRRYLFFSVFKLLKKPHQLPFSSFICTGIKTMIRAY
jgi:hypothetical protein